jgi:HK97 family phage major capsid protein
MNHLDTLYGRRANLINEVRSLGLEGGPNMTGEQRQSTDRLSNELEKIGSEIRSLESRDSRFAEASEVRAEFPHLQRTSYGDGRRSELRSYLLGRSEGSFEIPFTETRDLLVSGTPGAATVPTTIGNTVVEYLQSTTPMRRFASVLTTQSGEPIRLPVIAAAGTAAFTAEGSAFAESDPTLGHIDLKAFKYGQLLQFSSELLSDSAIEIDTLVGKYLGQALGRVTSPLYANGAGTVEPQGYTTANMAYGTTVGGTGLAGAPTYANLIDTRFGVLPPFRNPGQASWVMSDSAAAAIWKLTDLDGRPVYTPTIVAGMPDQLLGSPVFIDTDLAAVGTAARSIWFGDFKQGFYIRDVIGVRLDRSSDYAFANDLITLRAQIRTDSRVVDARALSCYKGGSA